jgi:hypothetical protein
MISGGPDETAAVMMSAKGKPWVVRDWERQPLKQYGPFDSKEEADIHSDLNERPTGGMTAMSITPVQQGLLSPW